ncbi:calcium-binding protein [Leptothoe sp. PORK10 BA2]|uniref:calcium-binding protein n=1 Tax=Leptothoe sp. PORK10 BA2 TaxID=3110254 RepID=UPI002B2131D8|nr:calcium-binding protein [Leptothoe sp. PORK10 BA2]MEA5467090.1 calcium-binding protein [Leptothoe sp. PORK10 BA2]
MSQTLLYNGALNSTPAQQNWLAYSAVGGVQQTQQPGFTNLNTSLLGQPGGGGYSNHKPSAPTLVNGAFPELNRSTGYQLSLRLRLNSENHNGSDRNGDGIADRAGLSLTAISSDRKGIELGFWTNEIWAQQGGSGSTLLTHSPTERAFLSTQTWTDYTVFVLGDRYYLSANGAVVLQGALKDYSAFNSAASGLPYNPYTTANLFTLTDNSNSASSNSDIARLSATKAGLGTANNDTLNGSAIDDLLNGLGGNDEISGLAGNDTLIGGNGNDRLNGGSGFDLLLGGTGSDRFIYNTNAAFTSAAIGIDTVVDFSTLSDRIILDKTTFTGIASQAGNGFSTASDFAIVSSNEAAAASSARIVYNTGSGGLFYNQNGAAAGFGSGAQFATLLGESVSTATSLLSASSFIIQA